MRGGGGGEGTTTTDTAGHDAVRAEILVPEQVTLHVRLTAGELTIEMNRSMESLKKSVNKLARLASETSLYLTQNVTKLTAEMKIYDTETEKLVSDNLAAERSIKEQRIGETIELAKKEYAKTAGGPKAG